VKRLFVVVAALVIAVDQYTKHLVAAHFLPDESRIVIPHVLWLTYVQNQHGAFGFFGSNPLGLAALASLVLVLFFIWYRQERGGLATHLAFALILGGAIGNIIDRVRLHYVVDFFDLRWFPVFNVADSCITIGVCLLLLRMLRHEAAPQDEAQPQAAE
jgi:signal peptidase II